jgi:MFS family permease
MSEASMPDVEIRAGSAPAATAGAANAASGAPIQSVGPAAPTGAALATDAAASATDGAQPAAGGLAAPLRLRDFRLLFGGESISVLGDQFHFVALAWLALQLTGSGLALGTVLMTAGIPRAVFMLLGGALSDRFSPRNLMLTSNAIRGVVVGAFAVVVLSGNAEVWHLYVVAAIFGVVDAFFYPALNAALPMLVTPPLLPGANALLQGTQQLAGLIGPAIAGIVVAAVQTGPAFAIDAASFGVAATALFFIRGARRAPASDATQAASGGSLLGTIGDGLRYAWADPAIRTLIVLIAGFNLAFNGPIFVGLASLADGRFGGGSAAFGILISAWGGGALLGAVAAGSLGRVPHLGAIVLALAGVMGIGLGLIGIAPNVPVAFAILAVVGLGGGFVNVRVIAWLQARVPETYIGRVMSLVMLASVGLAPLSLAASGALVDLGSVTLLFWIATAIILATVALGFVWRLPASMETQA